MYRLNEQMIEYLFWVIKMKGQRLCPKPTSISESSPNIKQLLLLYNELSQSYLIYEDVNKWGENDIMYINWIMESDNLYFIFEN